MKHLNTLKKITLSLLWVFLVIIAGELFASIIYIVFIGDDTSASVQAFLSALSYLFSLIILFLPHRKSEKKSILAFLGLENLPTFTDLALAPIALVATLLSSSLILDLFTYFPWFNAEESQDVGYDFLTSNWDYILAFAFLVLIGPLFEELIFRGYLYKKLKTHTTGKSSILISTLLTSLLFALLHGQWNVGIAVFMMSVFSCLLRELTGSLYASIFLHILKNALAFYVIYCAGMV